MSLKSGIYQIRNTQNEKAYVGSAKFFNKRWNLHRCELRANKHKNSRLQNAWNKYGEINFQFEIIERTSENLIEREQFYLDTLLPYYNIRKIAESNLGIKWTEESKANFKHPKEQTHKDNMSKARRGRSYSDLYGDRAKQITIKKAQRYLNGKQILKLNEEFQVLGCYSTFKEAYESVHMQPGVGTNYIKKAIAANKMYKKFYWQYL